MYLNDLIVKDMKTLFIKGLAFAAAVAAMASCTKDATEEEKPKEAAFPEKQQIEIPAGEQKQLSFTAEADWKLSIDKTTWCTFLDGEVETAQLSGLKGEVSVTVLVKDNGLDLNGKTVAVSGAGNVAIYAIQKAQQLGAKPVTCSDSTGWIYDPEGIDVELLREVKEVKRARLTEYAAARPSAQYHDKKAEGTNQWSVKVDIALPCATQNELNLEDAKTLVANGVFAVAEGANMPTTMEATEYLQENGVLFAPGKASNAGGVATSALEMSQNSERLSWTFEEVDSKLKGIMVNIFHNLDDAAKKYGMEGNYVAGANIAGFLKVAEAMQAQGIV